MPSTSEPIQNRQRQMGWVNNDVEESQLLLIQSKAVLVMTGAGISTSAGIPDFRSRYGLYAKGEIFGRTAFMDEQTRRQSSKCALALRNIAKDAKPTETHEFLRDLCNSGKLLRCYIQNIDMLEEKVGLAIDLDQNNVDCVELHGSLRQLRCTHCSEVFAWGKTEFMIENGNDSFCPACTDLSNNRVSAGKRRGPIGILLPDIVRSFQEHLFGERIAELANLDQRACPDLFLILGTSLKAYGAHRLAKHFARATRASGGKVVFVNIEPPQSSMQGLIDFWEPSDCDSWSRRIAGPLGLVHKGSIPSSSGHVVPDQELGSTEDSPGSSFWNPIELD